MFIGETNMHSEELETIYQSNSDLIKFEDAKVGDLVFIEDIMMKIENTTHRDANTVLLSGAQRGQLIYLSPKLVVRLIERKM